MLPRNAVDEAHGTNSILRQGLRSEACGESGGLGFREARGNQLEEKRTHSNLSHSLEESFIGNMVFRTGVLPQGEDNLNIVLLALPGSNTGVGAPASSFSSCHAMDEARLSCPGARGSAAGFRLQLTCRCCQKLTGIREEHFWGFDTRVVFWSAGGGAGGLCHPKIVALREQKRRNAVLV